MGVTAGAGGVSRTDVRPGFPVPSAMGYMATYCFGFAVCLPQKMEAGDKDKVLALRQELLHEHLRQGGALLAVGETLRRRDRHHSIDALRRIHGPVVPRLVFLSLWQLAHI